MKPETPVLTKSEYEVRPTLLSVAQRLVREFHYAKGGSNTSTYTHGLYRKGTLECLGVAWWIPPTKNCGINTYPNGDWRRVISLSRLVIVPEVPQNGASFLMGKSIRMIERDRRFECLVTYADTYRNHTGAIYKATNWEDLGLTKPTEVWTDSGGRMVARKAGPKTRTKQQMVDLGYTLVGMYPKHKYRIILPKIKEEKLCGLLNSTPMADNAVFREDESLLTLMNLAPSQTGTEMNPVICAKTQ